MNGEGIGSLSGIGNGWKDPHPTSTHKMLTEDLRCCGEDQALPGHATTLEPGHDPEEVPLWAHRLRDGNQNCSWKLRGVQTYPKLKRRPVNQVSCRNMGFQIDSSL
ncbi:MAG: hypothetical protein EWM73_03498 [Nitrospira sp.]|nr:MAG: hypothetical protein EWM73_03498 [Nitrospira sp.]